jgi:hypothetical protein
MPYCTLKVLYERQRTYSHVTHAAQRRRPQGHTKRQTHCVALLVHKMCSTWHTGVCVCVDAMHPSQPAISWHQGATNYVNWNNHASLTMKDQHGIPYRPCSCCMAHRLSSTEVAVHTADSSCATRFSALLCVWSLSGKACAGMPGAGLLWGLRTWRMGSIPQAPQNRCCAAR